MNSASIYDERGMTLIELMIAMVIGLFIIAGVGQIFLSTRASYNTQERMGNLQESGRFGLFFLQRSLRKAGFPKSSAMNAFTDTPSNTACPMTVPTADCTAASTGTCNGTGNNSDQISVCYQGTVDCLGQAPYASGVTGVIVDTFFIETTSGIGHLSCRGNGNAQSQPLIDGIENMQVQYGQDTDGDGYANTYVTAGNVTNWDNVVSVRVALLASTTANSADTAGRVIGDTASDAQTYQLLDNALSSSTVATGVRARVFRTTIELRNRTP